MSNKKMRERCAKKKVMRGSKKSITGRLLWHTKCISLSIHCPFSSLFFWFFFFAMSVRWGVCVIFICASMHVCVCGCMRVYVVGEETFICTNSTIYYEISDLNFYLLVKLLLTYAFAFCLSWVEVSGGSARNLKCL